jgi:hypothetical protein
MKDIQALQKAFRIAPLETLNFTFFHIFGRNYNTITGLDTRAKTESGSYLDPDPRQRFPIRGLILTCMFSSKSSSSPGGFSGAAAKSSSFFSPSFFLIFSGSPLELAPA